MPRDPDAVAAHERNQQELIEKIFEGLERLTKEGSPERISTFHNVARFIFEKFGDSDADDRPKNFVYWVYNDQVLRPIEAFTEKPYERECLLGRVLQKLVGLIVKQLEHSYSDYELGVARPTVHALWNGLPLCFFTRKIPRDWRANHRHSLNLEDITCPACKARAIVQKKKSERP